MKESSAFVGGKDAGAEVEGLITPDWLNPGAIVGDAKPVGREAASTEVSIVEGIVSGHVVDIVEGRVDG